MQTGTRKEEDLNDLGSSDIKDVRTKTLGCSSDENMLVSESVMKSVNGQDATVILLKKEIEYALTSLQEVQAEMGKLRSEKEEILATERCSHKNIKSLTNQALLLQDATDNFEGQLQLKVNCMGVKIRKMEEAVHECFTSCFQQTEVGLFILHILYLRVHSCLLTHVLSTIRSDSCSAWKLNSTMLR